MAQRTTVGEADNAQNALNKINTALDGDLKTDALFEAMTNQARLRLIRRVLVLLLRVAKRYVEGVLKPE